MQARRLGSYELIRRLGEGGMARVYLARDVRLGREVAVKVLEPHLAEQAGFRERFLREARVAASLDHPHIVPLYDFGESDGLLFLVMPFISGGSLQDMLKRAPLPVSEVVSYGSQIADALDYAHQRKVIHRDVKPANMLIHADGRLMLSDFGLAKILDTSRPAKSKGHPDAGTPEYMAPEQIEGHTDERSDVYGLGVVLYLLLTGYLPFTGSTSHAVMEGHLYRHPDQPRQLNTQVTPAIQEVVLRALAKNAEERYQRASDLSAALLAALVVGEAEPPPFFPLEDERGRHFSPIPPQHSMIPNVSPIAPEFSGPPAPLPWEVPTWEPRGATPRRSSTHTPSMGTGLASLPFDEPQGLAEAPGHYSPAFMPEMPGMPGMYSAPLPFELPQVSSNSGSLRIPLAPTPITARTTGGHIPALQPDYPPAGMTNVAAGPFSMPASMQSMQNGQSMQHRQSMQNMQMPYQVSGPLPVVPGSFTEAQRSRGSQHSVISHVTGPYPAVSPQGIAAGSAAPPAAATPARGLWQAGWFWAGIIAFIMLLAFMLGLALVLGLEQHHTGSLIPQPQTVSLVHHWIRWQVVG